jgi:vacuolar protein sorting-associated protein 45
MHVCVCGLVHITYYMRGNVIHVLTPPLQVVRQVQEFFADFLAVNHDLFHLGMPRSLSLSGPQGQGKQSIFQDNLGGGGGDHLELQQQERNMQGVLSTLLSLKRKPSVIRYSGTSPVAMQVATVCNRI